MKQLIISMFVVFLAGAVLAVSPVWGQDRNLSADNVLGIYLGTRVIFVANY